MQFLFVLMSLIAGGLLAVQGGANAQLSKATGSTFAATTLQLAIAGLLLLALAAITGSALAFQGLRYVPWWHALGGLASAVYVASAIILFPRLGAVVTVGLFIAGQMLTSFALDATGALGVPQQPPTAASITGTLMALIGAVAIALGQKGSIQEFSPSKSGWILLAFFAGAVLPVQGAVNGLLRMDIGSPVVVGTVSFAVASLAMLAVLVTTQLLADLPKPRLGALGQMPWWGWLGALCGALYVTTVFTAIPVIGTAATVGFTVAGQQIASLLVDGNGWFRLPKREISTLRYAGVAILMTGVALIQAF